MKDENGSDLAEAARADSQQLTAAAKLTIRRHLIRTGRHSAALRGCPWRGCPWRGPCPVHPSPAVPAALARLIAERPYGRGWSA